MKKPPNSGTGVGIMSNEDLEDGLEDCFVCGAGGHRLCDSLKEVKYDESNNKRDGERSECCC